MSENNVCIFVCMCMFRCFINFEIQLNKIINKWTNIIRTFKMQIKSMNKKNNKNDLLKLTFAIYRVLF